jgi:segregation and condensation protein B
VSVDGVLRTLQQRGFVTEVGRDTGPGQAGLFGTTRLFLERLGLDALGDLPPLGDFVPGPAFVEVLEQGLRPGADDDRGVHVEGHGPDDDLGGEDVDADDGDDRPGRTAVVADGSAGAGGADG